MYPIPFHRLAAAYPILANVEPELSADLVATSHAFACARREVLFETGTPCLGLPLLVEGAVRVSRTLASGQDVPLHRVGPGDLCALSVHALLAHEPHVARALAVDEVKGVFVPSDVFRALLERDAGVRRHVVGALAGRVASLVGVIEQVAATRLDERLARLLVDRGPVLSVTHQALADELGTAREVVSRILEGFETRGAVRLRRGRVEVLDRTRLAPPARHPAPRRVSAGRLPTPPPAALLAG